MICIKCQEEIYDYKICPFCNHNQDDPVIEIKTEENQEPVKKSCETCNKTYSSYDKECQLCEVTKEKLEQMQLEEEERYIRKQQQKKKTIIGLVIMAGVVFLLIIVLIISGIFITAKNIAKTSYEIMENQYLLYEEQTGLSREELFSPIDEKVAKTFLTEVNTYILDMQVQALESFYAMDLYNKYQNINLLQENCKKINKEIVSIYNKFETIETHNDPALKVVKEHILTMAIKPFYVYLNQTTSSGIKHDIVNINSATLELDDNYAEKLLFDFILVGQKAGLSDVETNAISKDVQKKYIPIFKQYEEFLTPEQEAILE